MLNNPLDVRAWSSYQELNIIPIHENTIVNTTTRLFTWVVIINQEGGQVRSPEGHINLEIIIYIIVLWVVVRIGTLRAMGSVNLILYSTTKKSIQTNGRKDGPILILEKLRFITCVLIINVL